MMMISGLRDSASFTASSPLSASPQISHSGEGMENVLNSAADNGVIVYD
jgi:hypothetical protein